MIRYIYFGLVVFFVNTSWMRAQDSTLHLYIANDTVTLDSQVCLQVRVNNFDSIEAFQLSVNFDPYLLNFESLAMLNQDLELVPSFFGLQEVNQGIVRLTYFDPFNSHTLPDSTVLFSICYTAHGNPGELCPVNLSDFPLSIEFIANEAEVAVTDEDAQVAIEGGSALRVLLTSCTTGLADSSGSFSVHVYGGNPPYFAIWQHTFNSGFSGGFGLDTFGVGRVVDGLIEGRYRFSITDEDGLRVQDSISLIRANPLNYSTEIQHPMCDNTADGHIVVDSVLGGIVPVQFKWSDGELFSTVRSDLMVGDYFLTITDPFGCLLIDTFILEANSVLASAAQTDESCLGAADGRFDLQFSGGQPYDSEGYRIYYLQDTLMSVNLSDSMLPAGQYTIMAEDSLGCNKVVDIDINKGLSIGVDELVVDHVRCYNYSTAFIQLKAKALTGIGIEPFSYFWGGTDSAQIDMNVLLLDGLDTGLYFITVTNGDLPLCSWDTSILIKEPPLLEISTVSQTEASCVPGGDGQATIAVVGGCPDGDGNYIIIWDNAEDSLTALQLEVGRRSVEVLDLEGCHASHQIDIVTSAPPTLVGASILNIRCDSLPLGEILTIFNSPFGFSKFIWSTGDNTSSIDSVPPGRHSCIAVDTRGCRDTFEFIAEVPVGPEIIDLTVQNIQCLGDSNGRLDVFYNLGVGLLDSIAWNDETGGDSLIHLRSGGYEVRIVDQNGCADTAATTLVDPDAILLNLISSNDTSDQSVGSILAEVSGGWTPYSFAWSPGFHPDSSFIDHLSGGTYYLSLTDAQGCNLLDTAEVDLISATNNFQLGENFSMYPNPASSILHLDWRLKQKEFDGEILVFDALGRRIQAIIDRPVGRLWTIDVGQLRDGHYWLVLMKKGEKVGTTSFIKNEEGD